MKITHSPHGPSQTISDIQLRRPDDLKPWSKNPRKHSAEQIGRLKRNIAINGFTSTPLVDENSFILSGHARVQAAKELGLPTIPTRVASGWSESRKRAFVISDNQLGLLSTWDIGLLKGELGLLVQDDFDLDLTAMSTVQIDLLLDDNADDPDDLQDEDIVAAPATRLGDLWLLGTHRLLCGDALSPASYEALMGQELAQMCITDPPYNVRIDGNVCGSGKVKHKEFAMASGEMSQSAFTDFLGKALARIEAVMVDGGIVDAFMDWRHSIEILTAAAPLFGSPRQLGVWVKDNAGMGTFYRSRHELVYMFKKGSAPHINNFELGQHGRYRTNVWEYPGINSGKGRQLLALHPTVKPVSLIADAIRDCSHRKGIVLDPFAGSGTILVAAERTGRYARAIELDPQYVDVAIHRWQRLTGKQATLAASGQTWEEVRSGRLAITAEVAP